MKNQEERSKELILENLKKKQLFLEKKRNYQKELIKVCREMLNSMSTSPKKQLLKLKPEVKKLIESKPIEETKTKIFNLTEAITKPKANISRNILDPVTPKYVIKDGPETDFMNLSPKYIIDKINEAQPSFRTYVSSFS